MVDLAEADQLFEFWKGDRNILDRRPDEGGSWDDAAAVVRDQLAEALNAQHVSFLFGSGCSSFLKDGDQVGIPTMGPLAEEFLGGIGTDDKIYPSEVEAEELKATAGIDLKAGVFADNLERLMEVLLAYEFALERATDNVPGLPLEHLSNVRGKVVQFILSKCVDGAFANGDDTVLSLYQKFYRKLFYRDRARTRPWIFTTNYDLFNEAALDRLGVPYANGFSGSVERRFSPANYRYSLVERMDLTNQKWSAVDSYIYLCKLHGSVNWVEDEAGLFRIRETHDTEDPRLDRAMIYPTPAKQSASFGTPYADLFREFQSQVVREQSVLVTVGFGFGDEHINNIIFQALTVPSFRLVAFIDPQSDGIPDTLRKLADPRLGLSAALVVKVPAQLISSTA